MNKEGFHWEMIFRKKTDHQARLRGGKVLRACAEALRPRERFPWGCWMGWWLAGSQHCTWSPEAWI